MFDVQEALGNTKSSHRGFKAVEQWCPPGTAEISVEVFPLQILQMLTWEYGKREV